MEYVTPDVKEKISKNMVVKIGCICS